MQLKVVGPLLLEQPIVEGQPPHLSAASGLVAAGPWLHVVADDALYLATFRFPDLDRGRVHRLFPDPVLSANEKTRKAKKPDLESLALVPFQDGSALLALGSGSTAQRRRGVLQPLYGCGEVEGYPRVFDLTPLYSMLPFQELNIEGLAAVHNALYLAQRGNSAGGTNAIIELDLEACVLAAAERKPWAADFVRSVRPLTLGSLDGVPLTLTDISPLNSSQLLFTAAAEDTADTYADGPIVGSVLGRYSLHNGETSVVRLDGDWKVEGVCALSERHVLMVTDGDDPTRAALLIEARI
jgi:hypothetical protein